MILGPAWSLQYQSKPSQFCVKALTEADVVLTCDVVVLKGQAVNV